MAALPTQGTLAQRPLSVSITASSVNKATAAGTSPRARASDSCCCTAALSARALAPPAPAAAISIMAIHLNFVISNNLAMTCLRFIREQFTQSKTKDIDSGGRYAAAHKVGKLGYIRQACTPAHGSSATRLAGGPELRAAHRKARDSARPPYAAPRYQLRRADRARRLLAPPDR